jgi:hypothetical protein
MPETVLLEPPQVKPKRGRIDYALARTLIAQHVTLAEAAKQAGAKDAHSLRVGLAQQGITATQLRNTKPQLAKAFTVAKQAVTAASEELKEDFAEVLAQHTAMLKKIKPRMSLKHISRVGQAMEPFARIAKIVHGWGDETKTGIVSVGIVQHLLERPDCGIQAPASGVLDKPSTDQTPQVAQVIEVESVAQPSI